MSPGVQILKDEELVHPADALAIALERVSGLLAVLGDLYNGSIDNFSGGNSFVVHGLSTAFSLVTEAQGALNDLHFSCDLTMLDHPDLGEMELPIAPVAVPVVQVDAEAAPEPVHKEQALQEQFAQSYLELLKKLTAAEVFASEQQALSASGSGTELLPLLRGLREEFQKLHNVA